MKNQKKGDASEIITFLIIVFFLAVSFLVVLFANSKVQEIIDQTELNSTSTAGNASAQMDIISTKTVQGSFVVIIAFLIIGMMISSFMVNVHPIFIFLYIFILSISVFAAIPLANTYEKLMSIDVLSTIANQQIMMNWIMEHLVLVLLGVGAMSMIVLFGKLRSRTSGGFGNDF